MSAFEDIATLVTEMLGRVAGFLVRNRFDNRGLIEHVECATLLIHGKKDEMISWRHSYNLFKRVKGPSSLMLSETMTHDSFDFVSDLTQPIYFFLVQVG